jgi:hypothetical protein
VCAALELWAFAAGLHHRRQDPLGNLMHGLILLVGLQPARADPAKRPGAQPQCILECWARVLRGTGT